MRLLTSTKNNKLSSVHIFDIFSEHQPGVLFQMRAHSLWYDKEWLKTVSLWARYTHTYTAYLESRGKAAMTTRDDQSEAQLDGDITTHKLLHTSYN